MSVTARIELPFALTDGERNHPLWQRLKGELENMLTALRGQNDNVTLTESQTAALRGKIGLLKAIIRLGEEMPPNDG